MGRLADDHVAHMMGVYLFEHRRTSVKAIHLLTFFLSGAGIYAFLHSLAPVGLPLLSPALLVAAGLCVWAIYLDVVIGAAYCVFVILQLCAAIGAIDAFGSPGSPFWAGLLITLAGLLLEGLAHVSIQKGPPVAPAQLVVAWSPAEKVGMTLYFVLMFGSFFLFCEVATVMGYRPRLRARCLQTTESYQEGHALFVSAARATRRGA